jgi:TRAP transporter TAXI family solute receptor
MLALFYTISRYIEPAPKKEITIGTGSKNGNYYQTALKYKKLLAQQGVKLHIVNTSGSVENLKLLKSKKIDIGFVQSGIIKDKNDKELLSLASIYYEPIWIFYKNRGYSINYIIELIGKKVAVGIKDSGTFALTKEILNANGITNKNTTFIHTTTQNAKQLLKDGKIDAMFMVTSPNSTSVKELLEDQTIELFNLKRVKAYNQKYKFLSSLILYEGTMNMYKNIPSSNINILATTANLVSTNNLNGELIRIFLKQVKKVHHTPGIFQKQDQFPSLSNLDTQPSSQAVKYIQNGDSWLERIFPFWIASNIDRLKLLIIPLLTLAFPLFKGIFPLYKWSMRAKIYKWYEKLDSIYSTEFDDHNEAIEKLNNLKTEVQQHTKVPLAYKGEYYDLLLHIDLIIKNYKM